jgi:SAM-dependent methyltransferase
MYAKGRRIFVSAARFYLDAFLGSVDFFGKVLDVGGKKAGKRGYFHPPMENVASWEYANIDPSVYPDFVCDAASIPVCDGTYDWVVLTEVLEHVADPEAVLFECCRVLRIGGTIVASMPFLYPVHADPHDFRRWTPAMIRRAFVAAGFDVRELSPRGGVVAVVLDLVNYYSDRPDLSLCGKIFRVVFVRLAPAVLFFDRWAKYKNEITTGYTIVAVKKTKGNA